MANRTGVFLCHTAIKSPGVVEAAPFRFLFRLRRLPRHGIARNSRLTRLPRPPVGAEKNPKPSTGSRHILRCNLCGRADESSQEDLLQYTRRGWPKCCGAVMTLFTEAEKPGPDDTALDRPPLPS
jgi:hypothetical protein